jgi:hypothetical protein
MLVSIEQGGLRGRVPSLRSDQDRPVICLVSGGHGQVECNGHFAVRPDGPRAIQFMGLISPISPDAPPKSRSHLQSDDEPGRTPA